jgi:GT2 family glycosyltransferase
MNVLVACPTKDRAWAVPYWMQGINDNREAANIDVVALVSESEDATEQVLAAHNVTVIHDEEPGRPVHEINDHQWGLISKFEYMSRLRNQLVDYAIAGGYDYFFSLDSDIVLPKFGLMQLLHHMRTHPGICSPSVNMVQSGVAWNVMHWTNPQVPMAANRAKIPQPGRADIIMAAMLIDRDALSVRWAAHMAGEDVGYCLDAESQGIPRWWFPDVRCQHLMRPI